MSVWHDMKWHEMKGEEAAGLQYHRAVKSRLIPTFIASLSIGVWYTSYFGKRLIPKGCILGRKFFAFRFELPYKLFFVILRLETSPFSLQVDHRGKKRQFTRGAWFASYCVYLIVLPNTLLRYWLRVPTVKKRGNNILLINTLFTWITFPYKIIRTK